MAINNTFNYKTESGRYNYYYRRLKIFYQKPVTQVSSAVLFTIFTIIFFAVFAIRPTLITISELLKKINDQKIVLEKAQKKAASLATAQQLYNQASADLPVIDQAIPPDYRLQQLLLWLESTAGNLDIPINNLAVTKLQYPLEPKKTAAIQEIPFTISFLTNYPQAKVLLSNLSQLPRLISIDTISFSLPELAAQNDSSSPTNEIKVSLNCRIFYYPEKNLK